MNQQDLMPLTVVKGMLDLLVGISTGTASFGLRLGSVSKGPCACSAVDTTDEGSPSNLFSSSEGRDCRLLLARVLCLWIWSIFGFGTQESQVKLISAGAHTL